jgi:cytochrome c oxidase cbb3-type subunit 3
MVAQDVRAELLVVLLMALTMATGCDAGRNSAASPTSDNADLTRSSTTTDHFAVLFATHCAGCHGVQGKLGPAPPLNDPLFLAIVPDEELLQAIQHGRRGTPMPAFSRQAGGTISAEEVNVLAAGIKRAWKKEHKPEEDLPAYAGTAAGSSEQIAAGAKVFARACAECHGEDGKGDPADTRPNAIHRGAFLALISDQALRRLVITGRPDLGMPNFAGTDGRSDDFHALTSDEIEELVALLKSWRDSK